MKIHIPSEDTIEEVWGKLDAHEDLMEFLKHQYCACLTHHPDENMHDRICRRCKLIKKYGG